METQNTQENSGLNIMQTSVEEAKEATRTEGRGRSSEYEEVATAWENAQEAGEAVVIEDVSENDVQNIRNLIYRRFNKEEVIVKSSRSGGTDEEPRYNLAVREREDGEYLRDGEEEAEDTEVVSEENEDSAVNEPQEETSDLDELGEPDFG